MVCLGSLAFAIVWWIGDVLKGWQTALLMITSWPLLGVVTVEKAYAPFAGSTCWLLIGAFAVATAVSKTGLLKRISYQMMKLFPPSFNGQVAALMAAGTICCPMVPSITAKCVLGGSIAKSTSDGMGYRDNSSGRTGMFMASWAGFGLMMPVFITGSTFGFVVKGFVDKVPGSTDQVTWISWFVAMLPWLIAMFLMLFLAIKILYTPKEESKLTREDIKAELTKMGKMGRNERIAAVALFGCMLLWVLENVIHVDPAIAALLGALLCFATGVLDANEIRTGIDWGMVIFVGAVLSLGTRFSDLGISTFMASLLSPVFGGITNIYLIILLLLVFVCISRFFITSQAVVILMFLGVMTPIMGVYGVHPYTIGLMIMTVVNMFMVMYQNPMYAASFATMDGTVSEGDAAKLGYVYPVLAIAACLICTPFWHLLGLM